MTAADIWMTFAGWVETNLSLVGPMISVPVWLAILLPLLIANTPNAKAQDPPIRGLPMWPGAHFQLLEYAFSREAWQAGGSYERVLLWLYRRVLIVGGVGIILLFAVFVSLDPVWASVR